ncbi:hypothetical protein AAY473_012979 [Plecturocebus cupreus]
MLDMSVASALQRPFSVVRVPSGARLSSAQLRDCGAPPSLCCSWSLKPSCGGGLALTRRPPNQLHIPRGHSYRKKTSTAHPKPNSSIGPWSCGTFPKEQWSACGNGNIYTEAVLGLVEISHILAAKTQRTRGGKQSFVPEGEKHEVGTSNAPLHSLTFEELSPLHGRKEFPEREDKDGLCCKRSPRLKTGELHMQLAREPETTNILSGKLDAKSLPGGDEASMCMIC